MRVIIVLLSCFMIYACNQHEEMKDIKDNILYKDSHGNIYLKRQIDIMSEKYSQNNQSRFFDLVLYKDSVYHLKNLVDVKTFKFVKSVTDTISINESDFFEDKNYVYRFQHLPPTSPEIKAIDK